MQVRKVLLAMAATVDEFRLPGHRSAALVEGVDVDAIIDAHRQWKVKLRTAITKQETLNVATVGADNCCPLGQWLHGEAKSRYSALPAYRECVGKHAAFHREAGNVARAINDRDYDRAGKMLDGVGHFEGGTTGGQYRSTAGAGLGRSAWMLYQNRGICFSSSRNFVCMLMNAS